eukprot:m.30592 g.30592  ORF g.30592 m.30592 type:complete len:127 (+) comp41266_c0_seq1:287-667(+)
MEIKTDGESNAPGSWAVSRWAQPVEHGPGSVPIGPGVRATRDSSTGPRSSWSRRVSAMIDNVAGFEELPWALRAMMSHFPGVQTMIYRSTSWRLVPLGGLDLLFAAGWQSAGRFCEQSRLTISCTT